MSERRDFNGKKPVRLSRTMKHSIDKGWQSPGSQILEENIRNGKTIAFHPSVDDAMQIEYYHMGQRQTTYVHWKDLIIEETTPITPQEPILFDVKNLDI